MREIDREALAHCDGKEGRPAYVAVENQVYDVTESRLWKQGAHMNRHQAGGDHTEALSAAPHGREVLERVPVQGPLRRPRESRPPYLPDWLVRFLEAYPFFKRHPHPMAVHFPMAVFVVAPLFLGWYYLIRPLPGLLDAVFYLYLLGALALPAAIATGLLSWIVNYSGKAHPLLRRKTVFSFALLALDLLVLAALVSRPALLQDPAGPEWVVPVLIFLGLPLASVIGEHGGRLVFPVLKGR